MPAVNQEIIRIPVFLNGRFLQLLFYRADNICRIGVQTFFLKDQNTFFIQNRIILLCEKFPCASFSK